MAFTQSKFDDYLTSDAVTSAKRVLENRGVQREMVEHNYRVAEQFFSYEVLEDKLNLMFRRPHNIYRLMGRSKRFRERMMPGSSQS